MTFFPRQQNDHVWYQIGIVSYGPAPGSCGNGFPGVYTSVASYIDWIKSKLKP